MGAYRGMGSFLRAAISVDNTAADFVGLSATGESDDTLPTIADGFHFYPLWEQVSLPYRARQLQLDCLLAPYNTAPLLLPKGLRLVVIIHDLIFMEPLSRMPMAPSLYQNMGRAYRRLVVPRAAARAQHIIAVSEFSKREICSRLQVPSERITTIHNSISEDWYVDQPTSFNARGNYILCIGGEAPSKNLSRAIKAYAQAFTQSGNAKDFPSFWIGGISPAMQPRIYGEALIRGIANKIHFLRTMPFAELQSIYRAARLVFVPSLQEGFGRPLLEAMASGTPAVCSNATSLPEVGGEAPLYVNPLDTNNMAQGLLDMLGHPQQQERAIQSGLRQAEIYRGATTRGFARFWNELAATRQGGAIQ